MFDPQEVHSAMAQQGGQHTLLLTLHEQWHEMVDLSHGHITFVVSANQGLALDVQNEDCRGRHGGSGEAERRRQA